MKKLSALWLFLLACMMATPAAAQFKWGVEAGVNLSKMSLSSDVLESSNRTGWFVGPKAQFIIPGIGLGVDGAVLYSHKYMTLEGVDAAGVVDEEKSMPYLEIPVNLKYNIGLSSIIGVYVATGPQYSFYMGGDNLSIADFKGSLNRSNFSWNVGLGINALSHLQVGVTYNIALGETGDLKSQDISGIAKEIDLKNNTWQVRLCYWF